MEWELLSKAVRLSNQGDDAGFTKLIMEMGDSLDSTAWEIIMTQMTITPEWFDQYPEYCKWLYDRIESQSKDIDWKAAFRFEYFKLSYQEHMGIIRT